MAIRLLSSETIDGNATFSGKVSVDAGSTFDSILTIQGNETGGQTQTFLHLNSGNNSKIYPFLATLNNADISSATFGWGFVNSNTNGNLELYRWNNTAGDLNLSFERSSGNATFAGNITIGGGHAFANDGNGDLEISSGSSDNMIIISNGTLSIRTGGNNERLGFNSAGTANFKGDIEVSPTLNKRIRFMSGTTFKGGIQLVDTGGQMIATSAADDLAIRSQSNMLFATGGNTERMRIASGGNVGIGTTSPDASLEINNTSATSDGDGSATETLSGQDSLLLQAPSGSVGETNGSITWRNGDRRRAMITSVSENTDGDIKGIAFYTRGTDGAGDMFESMRIAHSGKVGIGTTSPSQLLTIGDSSGSSFIDINKSTSGENGIIFNNAGNRKCAIIQNSGENLEFHTLNNNVRMIIQEGGNVGINTTSPSHKLHVLGDQLIFGDLLLEGSANSFRTISMNTSDGSDNQTLSLCGGATASSARGARVEIKGNEADGSVVLVAGNISTGHIDFFTANTERMIINNAGNVGIGTTSPNHKLDIYSNENVPLRIHRPSNSNLDISGAWGIGFSTRSDAITSTTDTRAGIFSYYNGNLFFATNTSSIVAYPNDSARMTILNTGLVGIGTTSPNVKLEVNGIISANGDNSPTGGGLGIGDFQSGGYKWIQSFESQPLRINPLGNNVLFPSSNVGIGTTSPKTNLEVIGGLNISTNTTSATTTTMRIGSYGLSSLTYYGAKLVAHTNFTQTANTDLSFDLGSIGEVMRLHSSGTETRVGIGTTSPDYKLDVAGEIGTDSYIRHNGDTDTFFGFSANDTFKARTGGSDRFHINNNGMGGYNPWNSVSTADQTNTTFNSIENVFAGNAMKYIGQQQIRDGSRYIDIALNSSSNNIMYYFYVIGYLYNRGSVIAWSSGYTYQNNSILNKNNVIVASAGNTKVINSYRGEDGVNGDYEGHLCLRVDTGANSYSEGYLAYYVGSHTPNWMSAVSIAAYAQNDQSNGNWFDQGIP